MDFITKPSDAQCSDKINLSQMSDSNNLSSLVSTDISFNHTKFKYLYDQYEFKDGKFGYMPDIDYIVLTGYNFSIRGKCYMREVNTSTDIEID